MSRKLLWFMPLALAVPAVAAAAYAPMPMNAPKMGPSTRISRPAFRGYYDGHKDTYLNTDVSNKADATAMDINYSRVLKTVPLASAPEIYLVQGNAAAGQLAVFGSEPGEPTYSPVWKETILSWKAKATPVLITSDTQIDRLQKQGGVTAHAPTGRPQCPIRKVGAAGH